MALPFPAQCRVKRVRIKIERRERFTDIGPGRQQRSQPVEHQRLNIPRRHAQPFNLNPNLVRIETLKPLAERRANTGPAQIRKLQASIEQFGFVLPIVIDATSRAIAGWGLALAAKKLGLPEVPAVTITDLDEPEVGCRGSRSTGLARTCAGYS